MLATIVAAVLFIFVMFAGMAIGVIVANKPVKGSCGGLNSLGLKEGCEICGGKEDECDKEQKRLQSDKAATLGKDVMKV